MGIYYSACTHKQEQLAKKEDEYKQYIKEHCDNVFIAFKKYGEALSKVLDFMPYELALNVRDHDESKMSDWEFEAYRQYFYPVKEETKDEDLFNIGWLHHQNSNPHHPEFWILRDDKEVKILDMPDVYIAEMLLDWEAMSMKFGGNTYDYYQEKGTNKPFSDNTRAKVEAAIQIFKPEN